MALELVALVAVSVSALMLAWKYQQAQQSLKFLKEEFEWQTRSDNKLWVEFQELLEKKRQLENQPAPSVYQVQLQLRNQDLLAQVAQLQSENQQLKVQLGYQQRLPNPQVATQEFEIPQVKKLSLRVQCHCSNPKMDQ